MTGIVVITCQLGMFLDCINEAKIQRILYYSEYLRIRFVIEVTPEMSESVKK